MTPAATVTGTGDAPALHHAPVPVSLPATEPGFYPRHRTRGVAIHLVATPETVSRARHLARTALTAHGADAETAERTELFIGEAIANAVHACQPHVPLVIEAYVTSEGAVASVHDPEALTRPLPRGGGLDDPEAESGRGLQIMALLAPGWTCRNSPTGKQVRGLIPHALPA